MGAPVAFFDITSPDPARIGDFYARLFDWTVAPEQDAYRMVDTGNGENAVFGGIGPAQEPGSAGITVYARVDDLAETLARAEKLGGATVVPPTDLPGGYGRFAVLTDPDGNAFGLWA
jgi:predicted enzyme related to lactoylglutathione lyase